MLKDYLKPEYVNSPEAQEIHNLFADTNPDIRAMLRVPVDVGDAVTRFLKRAVDPKYRFFRRNNGPRYDSMYQTCLRKDTIEFRYYFEVKKMPVKTHVSVQPKYCRCCGGRI